MGPPNAPPKSFKFRNGVGTPVRALKKLLADQAELRLYSKISPCKLFVPLLVTRLISAPEERPWSAFAFCVLTRNSSIASPFNRNTVPLMGVVDVSDGGAME